MKPNPFARLFAVLGFAALVGALLFSRDNSLAHRKAPAGQPVAEMPSQSDALYPSIQVLAETPAAPAADATDAAKPAAAAESKP
ncbi:MAG: hypothetical protein JST05_05420 [Acidobacteria bacterium]|nr:hypothetical protein [Acidobacteriota bacterium]